MEIYWVYYNIQKKEADFIDKLGHLLGTHWDEETLLQIASSRGGKDDKPTKGDMFIPLALAINPELLTVLKEARKPKRKHTLPPGAPPPSKSKLRTST